MRAGARSGTWSKRSVLRKRACASLAWGLIPANIKPLGLTGSSSTQIQWPRHRIWEKSAGVTGVGIMVALAFGHVGTILLRGLNVWLQPTWSGSIVTTQSSPARKLISSLACTNAASLCRLTLDCAGRHPGNDLPLEEHEHDQGRNRDDHHVREEQVPLRAELADEAEQRQLRGDVLCAGQKVERSGKI